MSIAAWELEYWSTGVMLLSGLTQHSMIPLLHYSVFSSDHLVRLRNAQNETTRQRPSAFRIAAQSLGAV